MQVKRERWMELLLSQKGTSTRKLWGGGVGFLAYPDSKNAIMESHHKEAWSAEKGKCVVDNILLVPLRDRKLIIHSHRGPLNRLGM